MAKKQVMSFTFRHVIEGRVNGIHVSRESREASRFVTQLYLLRKASLISLAMLP
jgi:hypothetical protein